MSADLTLKYATTFTSLANAMRLVKASLLALKDASDNLNDWWDDQDLEGVEDEDEFLAKKAAETFGIPESFALALVDFSLLPEIKGMKAAPPDAMTLAEALSLLHPLTSESWP